MKAERARVLYTGAGGGIGRVAVPALLQAGAAVMLVGRSEARLRSQALDLARTHSAARIAWHTADLLGADAIAPLVSAAASVRANVVVHGAGVPSFGRLELLAAHDLQRVVQTNLLAPKVNVFFNTKKNVYIKPETLDLSKKLGFGGGDKIVRHESPAKWNVDPMKFLSVA